MEIKRDKVVGGLVIFTIILGLIIIAYTLVQKEDDLAFEPMSVSYARSNDKPIILEESKDEVEEKVTTTLDFSKKLESEMQSTFDKIEEQRKKEEAELEEQYRIERERLEKERKELIKKEEAKLQRKNQQIARKVSVNGHFANLNLKSKTNFDAETYRRILEGTNLEQIAEALVECEELYNVNGLFLASLAALESGYGTSNIAITKNNITGFQAYDNATHMAKIFSSYSDCILHTAKHLSDNYLNEGGKYYNEPTLAGVNTKYSSSDEWGNKINNIMIKMIEKIK